MLSADASSYGLEVVLSQQDPETQQCMETSGIRIKIPVSNRTLICPNRKGGSCHNFGMWKVQRIHHWKTLQYPDRPQSIGTSIGVKMPGQKLPCRLQGFKMRQFSLHHRACPRKELTTADTLSGKPALPVSTDHEETSLEEDVSIYVPTWSAVSQPQIEECLEQVRH